MFEIFQLGTGGTSPLANRALASLAIRVDGVGILIDAGEGTQREISKSNFSFLDIDFILITHLHADHIGGLFGLLMAIKETCVNANNSKVITIVGPYKIKNYIENCLSLVVGIPFKIKYIELGMKNDDMYLNNGNLTIRSCKAKHGVPCFAYSVEYHRKRRFIPEKATECNIPVKYWKELDAGKTIVYEGVTYNGEDFLSGNRKGFKVSYMTDTRPTEELKKFISNSDVAIIEGMYRDNTDLQKAKKNFHMTWCEVAQFVKGLNINEVILTHYSPSLTLREEDREYLKSLIQNGTLGYDGLYRDLTFVEDGKKEKKVEKAHSKQYYVLKKFLVSRRIAFSDIEEISAFQYVVVLNSIRYNMFVYKTTRSVKGIVKNIYCFEGYYIFEV